METKEFEFNGFKISGFIALFLILAIVVVDILILSGNMGIGGKPEVVVPVTIFVSLFLIIFLAIGIA